MDALPNRSNFFCGLDTSLTWRQVAHLYEAIGWKVRKTGWYEYEISCSWADLSIKSETPMLMHGAVADILNHLDELLAPLRAAGVRFSAEFYGEGGELLQNVVELNQPRSG